MLEQLDGGYLKLNTLQSMGIVIQYFVHMSKLVMGIITCMDATVHTWDTNHVEWHITLTNYFDQTGLSP